jgi:hypothetical protein
MKSGFSRHDNFGFIRFWRITSLILLESGQRKVVFDFEITSGLFLFLVNCKSNSIESSQRKVVFYFKITSVCSLLANFSSNSIGIKAMKSGF